MWSDQESIVLAQLTIKYRNSTSCNKDIQKELPHRTLSSIESQKKLVRQKEIVRELLKEQVTVRDEAEPPPPIDIPTTSASSERDGAEPPKAFNENKERLKTILSGFVNRTVKTQSNFLDKLKIYVADIINSRITDFSVVLDSLRTEAEIKVIEAKRTPGKREITKKTWVLKRENRAARKARMYNKLQKDLEGSFSQTIQQILDGKYELGKETSDVFPEIQAVENFYTQKLSSPIDEDNEKISVERLEDSNVERLLLPFSSEEVETQLKLVNKKTAPGPDKWMTAAVLATVPSYDLATIYNTWMYEERVPAILKMNRTTLLYKGEGNREDVGNWRPITIGSLLLRVYTKCIAARLSAQVMINARQKAFTPTDGCYENITILKHLLKESSCRRREANFMFLDLSKAFDTVQHLSVKRAMRRKGVPDELINVTLDLYADTKTIFSVGKHSTNEVAIKRGVKQGCPLSPFLFNLVLDELVCELSSSGFGIQIGPQRVSVLAFADDLILCEGSEFGMNSLLSLTTKFFKARGMSINPKKSLSLRLLPVKGIHTMKVVTTGTYRVEGELVKAMEVQGLSRYLGAQFDTKGNVIFKHSTVRSWLNNLKAVPLKPEQKLLAIKQIVIPRLQYHLRIADNNHCGIVKIDRMLRMFAKRACHLPESTNSEWVHLASSLAGFGLLELCKWVPTSIIKALDKMSLSSDIVAQTVANSTRNINIRTVCSRYTGLETRDLKNAEIHRNRIRARNFCSSSIGRQFEALAMSGVSLSWLSTNPVFKGKKFVQALQIVSNQLPTRVMLHRGRGDDQMKLCRNCKRTKETIMHVLNECNSVHDSICKRHNNLCNKLSKDLTKKGYEVWKEQTFTVDREHYKPDIVALRNNQAWILDVTCPFESQKGLTTKRAIDKREKYGLEQIKNSIKLNLESRGHTIHSIKSEGIAIGSRGSIEPYTLTALKSSLGLGIKTAKNLSIMALSNSIDTWNIFRRSLSLSRAGIG
jgi:hypothetical protein